MSIIEQTTKLLLTQFKGSSIKPAFLEYYTADMKKLDDYAIGADARISALEAEDILLDGRLDTLESWKTDTVTPTLSDYGTRVGNLETWKTDTVTPALTDYDTRLDTLEVWKTDTVDTSLTSLDSRLDAVEEVIHDVSFDGYYDLVARLNACEQKVDANATDIETLNENLVRLDSRVGDNETAIGSLNSNLNLLSNRVTNLESCCTSVNTTLNSYNTRITTNESDIDALEVRMGNAEVNIGANADDITILATQNSTQATQIQDLYDKYNNLDPEQPTNLYSRVATLEGVVGTGAMTTTADTLIGAVNELDADNTSAVGRLDALESVVGDATDGLVKDVNDLEDRVDALETQNGSEVLTTTAQTLSGAVNELDASLDGIIAQNGNEVLTTTAQTLSGAVNELDASLDGVIAQNGNDVLTTTAQTLSGAVNELDSDLGTVEAVIPSTASASNKLATTNDLLDVYSETEHIVGTWIDGRPVYEITKYVQLPTTITNTNNQYSLVIENFDFAIEMRGATHRSSSTTSHPNCCISEAHNTNQMLNTWYNPSQNVLNVHLVSEDMYSGYAGTYVAFTMRYVKTS